MPSRKGPMVRMEAGAGRDYPASLTWFSPAVNKEAICLGEPLGLTRRISISGRQSGKTGNPFSRSAIAMSGRSPKSMPATKPGLRATEAGDGGL